MLRLRLKETSAFAEICRHLRVVFVKYKKFYSTHEANLIFIIQTVFLKTHNVFH